MRNLVSVLFLYLGTIGAPLSQSQDLEHAVWVDLTLASVSEQTNDFDSFIAELNDGSTGHLAASYELRFNRYFALGLGYLSGDSGEVEFFLTDWFTDSKIDYSSLFATASFGLPVTDRQSLFLDINHHEYEFDIFDDGASIGRQEGSDIGYALGWRIDFENRLGMEVGREHISLGSDLESKGVRVGVKYQF